MPDQGMQVTLEEMYQIIGEKEIIRYKLTEEVKRLAEQVSILTKELSEKEKNNG